MNPKVMLVIAAALVCALPLAAQQGAPRVQPGTPQAAPAAPAPSPAALKIVVLEGEGARNDIRSGTAVAPKIQVLDENGRPVADAEVVFRLPMEGPGGAFHGWVRTQTVRTNAEGIAAASGYTPNDLEGRFNIRVTAKAGAQEASAVISQANIRGSGASGQSQRKWWILAAVGAGAGAAIAVAAAGNGPDGLTVATPISITAGPVTVAGPR